MAPDIKATSWSWNPGSRGFIWPTRSTPGRDDLGETGKLHLTPLPQQSRLSWHAVSPPRVTASPAKHSDILMLPSAPRSSASPCRPPRHRPRR